ncbi:MAG: PD40 domain-containing protein [Verrucomicrobiales bacterium]|nr:PD40 domain-containing protein [Verrucomicrobiales bacterium]
MKTFRCFRWFLVAVITNLAGADLVPVSVRDAGSAAHSTASGLSGAGGFADGDRQVFFLSDAPDLVVEDPNGTVQDLFRRDRRDGRTELVSRATPGPLGYRPVSGFSVSGDGRWVALEWGTDVAALFDTNGVPDIYARDLTGGAFQLVSVRVDGTGAGDAAALHPLISSDGRFVAFESASTNLVDAVDSNAAIDVFLRDLQVGRTELISVSAPGIAADRESRLLALSDDGSVLVMENSSVGPGSLEGLSTELLVWRRGDSDLRRVVVPGTPLRPVSQPLPVGEAELSRDGRRLAFSFPPSAAVPTETVGIWVLNLQTSEMVHASGGLDVSSSALALGPVLSPDGRTIAFEVVRGDGENPRVQVGVWREGVGLRTLSEWVGGGAGTEPASSVDPVVSPDGLAVLFATDAPVPEAGVTESGRWQLYHRVLETGATRLVSREDGVTLPEFDATGRWIVLSEQEPVMVPGDRNGQSDVVVVGVLEGTREVVSLVDPLVMGRTASGNSRGGLRWSEDGRFLAFRSDAPDLVPGDGGRTLDAFLFDRILGVTVVATVTTNGSPAGRFLDGWLSGDGRRMVFSREGGVLTHPSEDLLSQVYVWDRVSRRLELASAADGVETALAGANVLLSASADARTVAFARGLPLAPHLLVRDLDRRRTWELNDRILYGPVAGAASRLQLSSDGRVAYLGSPRQTGYVVVRFGDTWVKAFDVLGRDAVLCGDGRHLVYRRDRFDGDPGVFIQDIPQGTVRRLTDAVWTPREMQSTPDGAVLVYARTADPGAAPGTSPVQVWSMRTATGQEELISRTPGGNPGSADSREPVISSDGRFVVFRSFAADLVPGDSNAQQDIFVHDRYTGHTTLLSRSESGSLGNSLSTRPEISADGRFVAFTTFADNLVSGDGNGSGDVVMTPLSWESAPDLDGDGLPDGWERDQFGSLAEDSGGDPDGDGTNNAAEYSARTVPTDPASLWKVVVSGDAGRPGLEWIGHAGVSYRVQRRDSLGGTLEWTQVGDLISGYGGILRAELPETAAGGFFRVVVE